MARWVPGALLALSVSCDSSEVEFEGYRFEIPAGWTASSHVDGAYRTLTFLRNDHSFACEVIVLRDGRIFRAIDATAFVADAREAFGAREEERAILELGPTRLEGYRLRGVAHRERWRLHRDAVPTLEIYAVPERAELFSLTMAGFDDAPEADRASCIATVRNARD
jgi:hypothetical protein